MQSLRFQAERRRAVGPTGPAAGEMQGRAGEAVGAGMEPFLPDDDAHPGRPADLNEQAGDVRHPDAVPDLAVSALASDLAWTALLVRHGPCALAAAAPLPPPVARSACPAGGTAGQWSGRACRRPSPR